MTAVRALQHSLSGFLPRKDPSNCQVGVSWEGAANMIPAAPESLAAAGTLAPFSSQKARQPALGDFEITPPRNISAVAPLQGAPFRTIASLRVALTEAEAPQGKAAVVCGGNSWKELGALWAVMKVSLGI